MQEFFNLSLAEYLPENCVTSQEMQVMSSLQNSVTNSSSSSQVFSSPAPSFSQSSTMQMSSVTTSDDMLTSSRESYLEVCINTGEYTMTLSEINLQSIRCDGELFKNIQKECLRLRAFHFRFRLLRPSGVVFV